MIKKVLLILETLYLRYSILSIFDNSISYLVNAKNTLYIQKMNKKFDGK